MKNSHRMFVQSLMSKGVMNAKDIFALLKLSCEKCNEYVVQCQEDQRKLLVDFVHHINDKLKVFGMEVRKGVDELNGAGFYGLVNITESSITLLASHYTDNEMQFFKKLVEMIVLSDNGCIGSIEAVHITERLQKKMSKTDAEDLLERLESEKWIGKTEAGKIYLAARAIMEMEQYILDMFGENAVRCFVCKKLAVQGQSCDHCGTKLHLYCYKRLFKDKPEKKCPECRMVWSDVNDTDSTMAATGTDADMPDAPVTHSQTRKRKAP